MKNYLYGFGQRFEILSGFARTTGVTSRHLGDGLSSLGFLRSFKGDYFNMSVLREALARDGTSVHRLSDDEVLAQIASRIDSGNLKIVKARCTQTEGITRTSKRSDEIGGNIIGWGQDQSDEEVKKTLMVLLRLTKEDVNEMVHQGLTKRWVEKQLEAYRRSLSKGGGRLKNTQLVPRKKLMEKILRLWPQ